MALVTDALLLRATDYRDADRIVTLFTRDAGKLSALARGARSSKRRFAGSLEPYAVIRVELEEGKGELSTLKRAELSLPFPRILVELAKMEAAAGALLMLRELHAPRVPDAEMFVAAVQYLTVVDHEGDLQRSLLLAFTMRALSLAGLAPRLRTCGRSGDQVPDDKAAYFDPALGAVVARRHGGGPFLLTAATRARLLACSGQEWLTRGRHAWDRDELANARSAVAAFVRAHFQGDLAARLFPD